MSIIDNTSNLIVTMSMSRNKMLVLNI